MILKEYQKTAVSELLSATIKILNKNENQTKSLVFKAPTGSGKTVMMQDFLKILTESREQAEICFIWISVNDLSAQSKRSFERNLLGSKLRFSELSDIQDKELKAKEILFINREKIRTIDKASGDRKVKAMKDNERNENLPTYLANTHEAGRKLILIVDESHRSLDTVKAQDLILNYIKPTIQIEVSATPDSKDYETRVEVNIDDVIAEGMIKKEILINEGLAEFVVDDKLDTLRDEHKSDLETDSLILHKAFQKQAELGNCYAEIGSPVQPLVLIQLPSEAQKTSEIDKTKLERVKALLARDFNITLDNKQLAIWLSEDKTNKDLIDLDNSPVKALIFKQAIATGRDCPRAQILVMFREIKTITFEIQTVGRILRMPERKHYEHEELNRAYVFTDLPKDAMGIKETAKNLIKNQIGYRRSDLYVHFTLPSYFKSRTDYKDIGISFRQILKEQFLIKVDGKDDVFQKEYNKQQLAKAINLNETENTNRILSDGKIAFGTQNIFSEHGDLRKTLVSIDEYNNQKIFAESDLEVKNGEELVEMLFENFVRNQVRPQFTNVARTYPPMKEALYMVLDNYFFGQQITRNYYQKLILSNQSFFIDLLTVTKDVYKPIRQSEIRESTKNGTKITDRSIPLSQGFTDSAKIEQYQKNIMISRLVDTQFQSQRAECFISFDSENEKKFIEQYLEISRKIKFRYKNGINSEQFFAIPYADEGEIRAFYPDFIVYFFDGIIGIFDTKSGITMETGQTKAEGLKKYLEEQRQRGLNVVGGVVDVRDGSFFIDNTLLDDERRVKALDR